MSDLITRSRLGRSANEFICVSNDEENQPFAQSHFDPANWLGEISFGLIMVLTVTHNLKDVNQNDAVEFTKEAERSSAKQALADGVKAEVHGQS